MFIDRRAFLASSGAVIGMTGAALPHAAGAAEEVIAEAAPITAGERAARRLKVRRLMKEAGIDALLVEPGSTMLYFTGVNWWRSERVTAVVIPADGEMFWISPAFEEPKLLEVADGKPKIVTWNEDESPSIAGAAEFALRKLQEGTIAIEPTVRHFVSHGLREAMPEARFVSGAGVVDGCRVFKSPAEIALMQRASDITIAAYRATAPQIQKGMMATEVSAIMQGEMARRGGSKPFSGVQVGEGSAYPHGLDTPQAVAAGRVILMDSGCTVDGYHSDISRTLVFGEPSRKQRKVWNLVRDGQRIAFETAAVGVPAGEVDRTVRALYESVASGPVTHCPACPTAPGTASASTFTSRSISSWARRRRCSRACACPTSRASISLASSACASRIVSI
jgi:Xaa-Pro dipeptidase